MTKKQFIEKWQPGYQDTNGTHKSDEWMRDFVSLFEDEEKKAQGKDWSDCDRPDLKLINSELMQVFDLYFDPADEARDRVTPENPPRLPVKFVLGDLYIHWGKEYGWWLVWRETKISLQHIASFVSVQSAIDFVLPKADES
jgi:hypothetical protein